MHPRRVYRSGALAPALALISVLGGCGGGATRIPATPGAVATAIATTTATVNVPLTLTVKIPTNATSATASVDFRLTTVTPAAGVTYNGTLDTDTLVVTAPGSSNCVLLASGEACSSTTLAPAPAVNVYTIYTFGIAAPIVGQTNPLTVYAGYALPVATAGANAATVAIGGVPAALAFSPSSIGNVAPAALATFTTSVQVQDAGGATIIGGANFATPVAFTGCDRHLSAVPPIFSAANPSELGADILTISYDGLGAATSTMYCNANGAGSLSAQFTVTLGNAGGAVNWSIVAIQRR
jgi:hypothetical protein